MWRASGVCAELGGAVVKQTLAMLVVRLLARFVLDGATGGIHGRTLARRLGVAVGVDQGASARFPFLPRSGCAARCRDRQGRRSDAPRGLAKPRGSARQVPRCRPASGSGRWAPEAALRARVQAPEQQQPEPPGAAAPGVRLTGFLTSTVTARVRPCENFCRTWVASALAAAPLRAVVERVSGLVALVSSFCSVISRVVLGPLRPVNRRYSADTRATALHRPQFVE